MSYRTRSGKRVRRQAPPLPPSLAQSLLPAPGWSIGIDVPFDGLSTSENHVHHWSQKQRARGLLGHATINILPDDALVEIFVHCLDNAENVDRWWHTLVHVCTRWRNIIFASPRYLDLQLRCTEKTLVREMLDVWPVLPIVISGHGDLVEGMDNIIAALEHHDRICGITLYDVSSLLLERLAATSQEPFPVLTSLTLLSNDESAWVLPDSFPVGSAPRLRTLRWEFIPFPGLPKLLLSANHLVLLHLWDIPYSGYISPQVMTNCLAAMTALESLSLGFRSPRPHPNQARRLPPPTPTILPALSVLKFKGVSEYLEDLLVCIDAPLLDLVEITFFNQLIFRIPQLSCLIGRTTKLKEVHRAVITFYGHFVRVAFYQNQRCPLKLQVLCTGTDWQLSAMAQICNLSLPLLSTLCIFDAPHQPPHLQDDVENIQWVELLHSFVSVTRLDLSNPLVPHVGAAMQGLAGEMATDVLPALQYLSCEVPGRGLSDPNRKGIDQFAAARNISCDHFYFSEHLVTD